MMDNAKSDDNIDVVIIWVDGSDRQWLESKSQYSSDAATKEQIDESINRYRDWGNLQFVFRGIEKFMPWVRTVHFVTNGHRPEWLDVNCDKLNFVTHSDYIPKEYLPTFSANPIELNLHRIPGLADKFIFFNDDMFVINNMKPQDFFVSGVPCDQISLWRALSMHYSDPMPHIMLNNAAVVNQHFNLYDVIKNNPTKWFSLSNSLINLILTASLLPISRNKIPALYYHHMPQAFLRSSLESVWLAEPQILDSVCHNKFRSPQDVSQGLIKNWQVMAGNVHPKNIRKISYYSSLNKEDLPNVERVITHQSKQMICLNDALVDNFDDTKARVINAFNQILPDRSRYEK